MTTYPHVLSELETLALVCQGRSLARFGDGEFHLVKGRGIPCQRFDPGLANRLRGILAIPGGRCLVGIPNLHSPTPKAAFWQPFTHMADALGPLAYVSAFVTRPDSAPWLDTPAYWLQLESLWIDQDVTLVRGGSRSLTSLDLFGAKSVTEIVMPRVDAWASYRSLWQRIKTSRPTRVLACLGPTATVLAVDCCAYGIHCLDLGHIGMFLKKHRRGEPMIVTDADKVA